MAPSKSGRLLLLAPVALALTTCMLPKSEMLKEDAHHLRTHAALTERYGAVACLPERVPPDTSTTALRPDPATASHKFAGDVDGLRENVFVHEHDGTHDYAERWDVGLALDWEILNVGWDWKVGCRIHQCDLPDGLVCCYQQCVDGGSTGMAYEAPDRFGCMNSKAGGAFQWFLDGLHQAGVPNTDRCG